MITASFSKQTGTYFRKNFRIAIRENAWIYLLFAVIISLIVALVTSGNMFDNFENTQSGFFTLASACIWIGIFNSIQSVCREHDIISSEYRDGAKLSSYICAQVLWQAVLCLAQTIIIFIICIVFKYFGESVSDGAVMNAHAEYFITIFLLTFGSAVLGIMVSSIADTPTTAMKIMPFVLILQLIMSGVLFELSGVAEYVAYITFTKWGMSAFCCTGDINFLDSKTILKITEENDALSNMEINYEYGKDLYEQTSANLFTAWGVCIILIIIFIFVSILFLQMREAKKRGGRS